MEFAELKSTFLRELVVRGYQNLDEVPLEVVSGIPKRLTEKWMVQFKTAPPLTAIPKSPRLINGFTIGADPEYSFIDKEGKQFPAMKAGLQTGLAFGMDMNGRLAELRPAPSTFALDVVASMLAELRWLAFSLPNTLEYSWLGSPFDGQDGCGGHVHLARKRDAEHRMADVGALATTYSILLGTGVFSKSLNDLRVSHTKYGRNSDYRLQKHGYEYRSFPTFMDGPWLAYFTLTVAKLALFDGDLLDDMYCANNKDHRKLERSLINLISYYKNVDDDAWIAFHAIRRWGLPKQAGVDIKSNWGIVYPKPLRSLKLATYYPSMINPSDNERMAIFNYLVNKEMIRPEQPTCNWEPKDVPQGYQWLMHHVQTYHKVGIGEIVNDLVCSKNLIVDIHASERPMLFLESHNGICRQGANELVRLKEGNILEMRNAAPGTLNIHLPDNIRTPEFIPEVKRILTSGLFPLWNIKDVKAGSYDEWVKNAAYERKSIGKELVA